jgi:hypothetical protein
MRERPTAFSYLERSTSVEISSAYEGADWNAHFLNLDGSIDIVPIAHTSTR